MKGDESVAWFPARSVARTVSVWPPSAGASDAHDPKAPVSIRHWTTISFVGVNASDTVADGVNGAPSTAPSAGLLTVSAGAPRSSVNVRVTVATLPTSSWILNVTV